MATPKTYDPAQITAFIAELKSQSDRGAAIVAAAVLEEMTEMVLLARFIELSFERKEALFDRMNAPLSAFSAKIEIAFAVGIINNAARLGLHLVRDVRNKFAHRIEAITFNDPAIARMLETRGSQTIKALNRSSREKFLAIFHGLALVLYSTIATDIRLKAIEQTHVEQYLTSLVQAMPMYVEAAARAAEGGQGSAESLQPKQR